MRISAFVLDTSEAFDKAVAFARKGWLGRVYLQAEYWPHAAKNRAAFPSWKAALNPLGCAVYATLAGYDAPKIPERIAAIRAECQPQGWTGNFETLMTMEGVACDKIMRAFSPEPVVISYNVLAEQGAFDFRRFANWGAEIHGQAYDPDGDSTKGPSPAAHVTSAFAPVGCWGGGGGPAWWYRVLAAGKWSWRWIEGFDTESDQLVMRTNSPLVGRVYAAGEFVGGHLEFSDERVVTNKAGLPIGKVAGFGAYHRIGYSLGTTRPVTAADLAKLAKGARAPGMPICRKADLYTLENSTEAQVKALAEAA